MLHKDIILSGTPSSGVYAVNTDNLVSCLCKLILITATTNTTTFDFKILDSGSRVVYHKEGITGTLRDTPDFPLRDINTLRIENASTDEAFTGKVSVMEVT